MKMNLSLGVEKGRRMTARKSEKPVPPRSAANVRAAYLNLPPRKVVTRADKSHTATNDLLDRGLELVVDGIRSARKVERCTIQENISTIK